ncbi:hypothetical protein [Brevundimonas sp.]|uniref:hypothetical protein n=1 Tax=Brevundimonas sp. TaxID=1871086 RepID=UPI002D353B0C|nr:hypothetical protein [Brevundimonas sp.]HYC66069.1 hypothetical protein [Reyranellaceae bacterium]HYC74837.1 hypothetical protein [Brevundimonas sp.]
MAIVLRAQITIDVSAEDFVSAADHQKRIETLMSSVRETYGQAELEFRERRPRTMRTLPRREAVPRYTGAVAEYADD